MTTLTIHPDLLQVRTGPRWQRLALCAIALGGLALTMVTLKYYGTFIRGADAQMYYAQARSLVVDGDLAYENEITQLTPQRAVFYDAAGHLRVARTADGTLINKYTFGWALITLPAFAAVHAMQTITGGDTSGYAPAYDITTALWHLFIVIAASALLMRTAARLTDDRCAALAVVATFFGTNLAYYTCVYPTMAHAASYAMVAIALSLAVALYDEWESRWLWIAAAMLCGLVVLLRPTDGVLLLAFLPAISRAWHGVSVSDDNRPNHHRRARWLPLLLPVGVVLAVALQLIIWRISYGQWVGNSYGNNGEGFNWLAPAIPAILTSTHHGAWYWHPMFALGFAGLIVAIAHRHQTHRPLWLALLAGYVLHVYVHASWHDWAFSHSFGHRMFANSAPVIALGLAALLHRLSSLRFRLAFASLAALALWNGLLIITFIRGGLPAVGPVTPSQMITAVINGIGG